MIAGGDARPIDGCTVVDGCYGRKAPCHPRRRRPRHDLRLLRQRTLDGAPGTHHLARTGDESRPGAGRGRGQRVPRPPDPVPDDSVDSRRARQCPSLRGHCAAATIGGTARRRAGSARARQRRADQRQQLFGTRQRRAAPRPTPLFGGDCDDSLFGEDGTRRRRRERQRHPAVGNGDDEITPQRQTPSSRRPRQLQLTGDRGNESSTARRDARSRQPRDDMIGPAATTASTRRRRLRPRASSDGASRVVTSGCGQREGRDVLRWQRQRLPAAALAACAPPGQRGRWCRGVGGAAGARGRRTRRADVREPRGCATPSRRPRRWLSNPIRSKTATLRPGR